ncbi:DUF4230 domain-containing protein [Sphingobacterium daejeonense]|uniref:DUF4230 domain-containing protein n=1 Tax=Sphingobacterium daejeonense TaxID=371142 RepID=UPI0021A39668|nr:DUF4230 domain-containing protein [Sphingobacterium daejeonense]MCT1532848.1 DUF4230 domain-containing protein [Sphingobacterium daejeonense]
MTKLLKILIILGLIIGITWFVWERIKPGPTKETRHQVLVEKIEAMGKLELVKYRLSDVVEHKNMTAYLPDASVLLIIKADAVGCIDLSKLTPEDVKVMEDSVTINLPKPEICYVKIDHKSSKVYDTKMAFFREATLVDEAFKAAEEEITRQVNKSDILDQTKNNATHVLRPLLEGLGYTKINLTFD